MVKMADLLFLLILIQSNLETMKKNELMNN